MKRNCSFAALFLTVLALAAVLHAESPETKRLMLLGQSPDGHPPKTHEYMAGVKLLAKCLQTVPNLETRVENADAPWSRGPQLLEETDGAVLFLSQGAKWLHDDPRRLEAFAKLAQRGGGLAVVHWGMGTREAKNIDGFLKLFGGCHGGPDRKYKVLPRASVELADPDHPICTAVNAFVVREEFYYRLKFVKSKPLVTPILRTKIDGNLETVCWAWQRPDGGRSFGFSGGHFHDNWRHAPYRRLIAQGILWTLKLPVPKDGLAVAISEDDLKLP